MPLHGVPWPFMALNGASWLPMALNGPQWPSMVFHGPARPKRCSLALIVPWKSVSICFVPWPSIVLIGPQWCSIALSGTPWCSMVVHCVPWPSTEGDSIREGLWHQRFPKMAKSNSLSFMVLFMCKKHVMKHRINIWPFEVYLSLGIIKRFSKKKKKWKKKSSDFSKIKISLRNSYSRITKMLKFLKNSNFLPKKRDKTADCKK